MSTFFSSDTHFHHKAILRFCPPRAVRWPKAKGPVVINDQGEPVQTWFIEEMNEGLIERWNDTVGVNDEVYHLGDFSFGNAKETAIVLRRLRGKIHLVSGNHDKVIHDNAEVRSMFASVRDYREINHNKIKVAMFHFPIYSWHKAHHGSIHVHGHTHNSIRPTGGKRLDIGVDSDHITGQPEHRPFSIDEVFAAAAKLKYVAVDHHLEGRQDL